MMPQLPLRTKTVSFGGRKRSSNTRLPPTPRLFHHSRLPPTTRPLPLHDSSILHDYLRLGDSAREIATGIAPRHDDSAMEIATGIAARPHESSQVVPRLSSPRLATWCVLLRPALMLVRRSTAVSQNRSQRLEPAPVMMQTDPPAHREKAEITLPSPSIMSAAAVVAAAARARH